jgi:hypothetical protein
VLQRTRLSDSQFIGDLLAVICEFLACPEFIASLFTSTETDAARARSAMCASALKSGTPLPQVTPGPLVERLVSEPLKVLTGPSTPF